MMMAVKQQLFTGKLSSILQGIATVPEKYDVVINNLVSDSRQVAEGDLFIALGGNNTNASDFIDTAVEKGAAAVVWDAQVDAIPFAWSAINKNVPLVAVENLRQSLGKLANQFYNHPSEKLNLVGVTGTNGKTSCVNYIAQALEGEQKCGLIGTLGNGVYPQITAGTHTTPDVITVHKTLAEFLEQGAAFAAVEVSSHALAQGRVDGVHFNTAIFTNLTQDHLDYHGSMAAYLDEKVKLFNSPDLEMAIINLDDPAGQDIIRATTAKNIITYSLLDKSADFYATDICYKANNTFFRLTSRTGTVNIKSSLAGDFNIRNLLAVSAYLSVQGFSFNKIAEKLETIKSVEGRMQKISVDGFPMVIVDYAHTPDALEHVLQTLSVQYETELSCVFGCGGERDQDKRKQMGAIADKYADYIVLTNDNPRTESPEAIIEQIASGISDKEKLVIETDRAKAIQKAISHTTETGCVLVAGKGHENYQIIGTNKTEFKDAAVIRKYLSK